MREIKAIVLAEAREIMVGQPGAGNIEDAAGWDIGDVPQGAGVVRKRRGSKSAARSTCQSSSYSAPEYAMNRFRNFLIVARTPRRGTGQTRP
jgi:hypothetical protein